MSYVPSYGRKVEDSEDVRRRILELEYERDRQAVLEAARKDINVFIEYVFGIKQHPFHRKLQDLANRHQHLCLDAPIEHGKTFQFSQARPLWLLGNNPHHTLAIVGNATEHPEACLDVIRKHIEGNERLHEVFPKLKLREATQKRITVDRGMTIDRDPSLVAIGVGGSIIGRRWSGIILDDIQDFDNTWTHTERVKLWKRLESTILGRLVQSGFLLDIGTPWHVEDARHRLRNLPGYEFEQFDAENRLWPEKYVDPLTGKVYGWPQERLEMKKRQMSMLEYSRQFRCVASSSAMRIFSPAAVEDCVKLGRGRELGRPHDGLAVTGVDVAVKKADSADRTVLLTGTIEKGVKDILDIRAGHWEISEICQEILDVHRTYPGHRGFRVETNAAQDYLRQVLTNRDLMRSLGASESELDRLVIIPHQTQAKTKYDPITGIRGLAIDFEQRRIRLPCDDDGVPYDLIRDLVTGLLAFDPMGHTNDIVMALWLFAEEIRRHWVFEGEGMWQEYGIM